MGHGNGETVYVFSLRSLLHRYATSVTAVKNRSVDFKVWVIWNRIHVLDVFMEASMSTTEKFTILAASWSTRLSNLFMKATLEEFAFCMKEGQYWKFLCL